jgi:3-hydroxybutyryl-CoA dehydrogenase
MGPFELMDMIGHDVNFAVTNSVWRAYFNDPRFQPSLVQQDLVDAGFLGKKTGRGFYNYQDGASKALATTAPAQAAPKDIVLYGQTAAAQALVKRLQANSIAFTHGGALGDTLATTGGATLRVTDGRSATRCAFETHTPNTVLIDLALDYDNAARLAVGVAAQCDPSVANSAMGLLQAAGFAVSQLQDIPGLIVMRTVAMLANEAADAVNQGVCDASAVDTAMRLGVNYPCGPLAWADAIGLGKVSTVLSHLAQTYGEDRYRTSPLIQHHVFAQKAFL